MIVFRFGLFRAAFLFVGFFGTFRAFAMAPS